MIDKFLEIGASFDWISPIASIIQDVLNGPSHTFLIPIGSSPMTGREIERMLRSKGVTTWGAQIVAGTLTVSVKLDQANHAQHLLEQAGVPIENPLPTQKQAPKRKASKSSPFSVFGIFDR